MDKNLVYVERYRWLIPLHRVARALPDESGHDHYLQHIAKTAGSSIGEALGNCFPIEQQLAVTPGANVSALGTWSLEYPRRAWEALPSEQRSAIRYVGGHLPFGVHRVFRRPAKYVTLLRDPVERILSGYYYSIDQHIAATGEHVTLEEYVFRKRHYDLGLNNYQTRLVSGVEDLDPFGSFTTENARPINENDLAIAMRNLQRRYVVVGVTERAEEFLARFAQRIHLPSERVPPLPKRNVTKNRMLAERIEPHILSEIRKHNEFDLALYDWAKRSFEAPEAGYAAAA